MKKKILGIAVVAVSFFVSGAMAQTNCGKPCDNPCDKKECPQKPCVKTGKRQCPNPFDGLNLTKEQQDKLKNIAPCDKNRKECKKKQRECRDSIARVHRQNYLNQVKSVLTKEQYEKFLENMVVNQPKPGKMMRHMKCPPKGVAPCGKAPVENGMCPKAEPCKK